MNISYNWLKKHVTLPDSITSEMVAEKLKLSTVEVENIIKQGDNLENIVVGKVLKADKHPNADKLKLCQVDLGKEKVQIVCGGSNVTTDMLVAVAKVGAKVRWHGEGELVEIVPTKIRDIDSYGMICAGSEIGLVEMFPPKDEKEILDLTALNLKVGAELKKALGLDDVILEIDNKSLSNRPDLWGHYGIAREVAVLFPRDFGVYETKEITPGKEIKLKVTVEDEPLCPRYMAVAISGVQVGPSPLWLQRALSSIGLRSINNIVDITNYIMFDLGQPLHAFDAQTLQTKNKNEKNIIVRTAKEGEKFKLLDEKDLSLTENDLVIADDEKPIALAGVMGGFYSGINDNTTEIILEAATFDPVCVRKTALHYDSRTDSSARFEKSLDPNMAEIALKKAVEMALELCPQAKVSSNVEDKKNFHLATGPLQTSVNDICKKLGVQIEKKEIVGILQRLGFEVKEKGKDGLSVKIPTWRATKDISLSEDLIEEVGRIYGYDKIDSFMPEFEITPPEKNILRDLEHNLRNILTKELGYDEVYNYSFVSGLQIDRLGEDKNKYLELDNPLSSEKPYLRRELLPNLLENVQKNIENFDRVNVFEIGKTYLSEFPGARAVANEDDLLPRQDTFLSVVNYEKKSDNGFIKARLALEKVMENLQLSFVLREIKEIKGYMHPGRAGEIVVGDQKIGFIYELNPLIAKKWDLNDRVGVVEINLSDLRDILKTKKDFVYQTLSQFPEPTRDLAFVADKKVTHQEILEALKHISPILKSVELFDVYEGEHVKEGFKSMAYHFVFSDSTRTLKNEEVDDVMGEIIKILKDKFGVEVRG